MNNNPSLYFYIHNFFKINDITVKCTSLQLVILGYTKWTELNDEVWLWLSVSRFILQSEDRRFDPRLHESMSMCPWETHLTPESLSYLCLWCMNVCECSLLLMCRWNRSSSHQGVNGWMMSGSVKELWVVRRLEQISTGTGDEATIEYRCTSFQRLCVLKPLIMEFMFIRLWTGSDPLCVYVSFWA